MYGRTFRPPIQRLHVPSSIPVGAGIPSPLPPQLTSREAGWVEGDNSFLRYAQVATAKDIAGMHPDALTSFAQRGSRVAVAEAPLRPSDLLHTPLMLAMMRADRKARRRKMQAALLAQGGLRGVMEEAEGGSSDDASSLSDADGEGGFEAFDEDLMAMLLAQGRHDLARAYKDRFSSHKARMAEAEASKLKAGEAKRIAARAAREAALERSRAEMQRKKDAVKRRWEAAQRAKSGKGVQGGDAADMLAASMRNARRNLDAGWQGGIKSSLGGPGQMSFGGNESLHGADRDDSFSPRAAHRAELDLQRVGSWRKGYKEKVRAAPLGGVGVLSPGDPPQRSSAGGSPDVGRAGLGKFTDGQAPELGQGGSWVDRGAGMDLEGARHSSKGHTSHRLNAEQAAAAAALAAGTGRRDSKLAAKLQRQYEAGQKKLAAAKKRRKRATKARGFKFHSSSQKKREAVESTETAAAKPQAIMRSGVERDVFRAAQHEYNSDGSDVDSAGALSDWERRFVVAQAKRVALLAARRCKKNKKALKAFRTLPQRSADDDAHATAPSTRHTSHGSSSGVTSAWSAATSARRSHDIAQASRVRRLARKDTASTLGSMDEGVPLHRWWAQLSALAQVQHEQKRRNVFHLGNMQLQGDKANAARRLAAKTASSAIASMLLGGSKGVKGGRRKSRRASTQDDELGISPESLRADVAAHIRRRELKERRPPQQLTARGGSAEQTHISPPHRRPGRVGAADVFDGLSSSDSSDVSADPMSPSGASSRDMSPNSIALLDAAGLYSDSDTSDGSLGVDVWGSGYGADWMAHMQRESGLSDDSDGDSSDSGGAQSSRGRHANAKAVLTPAQLEARRALKAKRTSARKRKGRTFKGAAMAVSFMGGKGGKGVFNSDALAKARAAAHRFAVSRGLAALARDGPLAVAGVVQSHTTEAGWVRLLRLDVLPSGGAFASTRRALRAAVRGRCAVSIDDSVLPALKRHFIGHVGRGGGENEGQEKPNASLKPAPMVLGAPLATRAARRRTPEWAEHVLEHGHGLQLPAPWVIHHTDIANTARRAATGLPSAHVPPRDLAPYAHGGRFCIPLKSKQQCAVMPGTKSDGCSWSDSELEVAVAVRRRTCYKHGDLQRYASGPGSPDVKQLKMTLSRRTVYAGVTPRVLRSWAHRWLTHYGALCRKVTSVWLTPRVGGFLARLDALLGLSGGGDSGDLRAFSAQGQLGDYNDLDGWLSDHGVGAQAASAVLGSSIWGTAAGGVWGGGALGDSAASKLVRDMQRHTGAGSLVALRARGGAGRRVLAHPRLVQFGGDLQDIRGGSTRNAGDGGGTQRFMSGRRGAGRSGGVSVILPPCTGGGDRAERGVLLRGSVAHASPLLSMRSRAVAGAAAGAGRLARQHQEAVLTLTGAAGGGHVPRGIAGTVFLGGNTSVPTANLPMGDVVGVRPDAPHESPFGGGVRIEQLADSDARSLTAGSDTRPLSQLARRSDGHQASMASRTNSILAESPWRVDPDVSVAQRRAALQGYVGQWGALIAVQAGSAGRRPSRPSAKQQQQQLSPAPLRGLQAYYAQQRAAAPQAKSATPRMASTAVAAAAQLQHHLHMHADMLRAAASVSGSKGGERMLGGGFRDTTRRGTLGSHLAVGIQARPSVLVHEAMARYPSLYAALLGGVSESQDHLSLESAPPAVRTAVHEANVLGELQRQTDDSAQVCSVHSAALTSMLGASHALAAARVPGWHATKQSSATAEAVSAWDAVLKREVSTFMGDTWGSSSWRSARPPPLVQAPSAATLAPVLGEDITPDEAAAAAASKENSRLVRSLLARDASAPYVGAAPEKDTPQRVPLQMRSVIVQSVSAAELHRHGRSQPQQSADPKGVQGGSRAQVSAEAQGRSLHDIRIPGFVPHDQHPKHTSNSTAADDDEFDTENRSPHTMAGDAKTTTASQEFSPPLGVDNRHEREVSLASHGSPTGSDGGFALSLGGRSASTLQPAPPPDVHERLHSAHGVLRRPRGAAHAPAADALHGMHTHSREVLLAAARGGGDRQLVVDATQPEEGGSPSGGSPPQPPPPGVSRTWRSSGDSIRRLQDEDVRRIVAGGAPQGGGSRALPTHLAASSAPTGLSSDAASVLGGRSVDSEGAAVSLDPVVGGLQLLRQPLARAVPAAVPRLTLPSRPSPGLGFSMSARSFKSTSTQPDALSTSARPQAPGLGDDGSGQSQAGGVSRWRKYTPAVAEKSPTVQDHGAAEQGMQHSRASLVDPMSIALSGSASGDTHAHRALLDSAMAQQAARQGGGCKAAGGGLGRVRSTSALTAGQLGTFQVKYAKAEYKRRKRPARRRRRRRRAKASTNADQVDETHALQLGLGHASASRGSVGSNAAHSDEGAGSDWESDGSDVDAIMARVLQASPRAASHSDHHLPVGILKEPGASGLFSSSASAVAFKD